MQRCLELAVKGSGKVSPNPMVGAILVHEGIIIGEGWHREYGGAHAEVNCLASVKDEHKKLIPDSTMYVSLEPCAHFGKTPPCADFIISNKIPRVIIGCTDTYNEVSGRGIEKLLSAGIQVETGVLQDACRLLNRRFFTYHEQQRPYIILKWAESADGFIAPSNASRFMLSNALSQRLVHKMRMEEDSILVGYHTAITDNPQLNNRLWYGKSPVRLVWDNMATLPDNLNLLDGTQPTLIFNYNKEKVDGANTWVKIDRNNSLADMLTYLHRRKIMSLIVEGGRETLQKFIDSGCWDEALVIQTPHMLQNGTKAPVLPGAKISSKYPLEEDQHTIYTHG